ncbi:MAG: class I SAM-dependent methyltransferase [Nannocystaceae bacterium]
MASPFASVDVGDESPGMDSPAAEAAREAVDGGTVRIESPDPESPDPEPFAPESLEPEALEPESPEPESPEPESLEPESLEPESLEPSMVASDMAEPALAEPAPAEPESAERETSGLPPVALPQAEAEADDEDTEVREGGDSGASHGGGRHDDDDEPLATQLAGGADVRVGRAAYEAHPIAEARQRALALQDRIEHGPPPLPATSLASAVTAELSKSDAINALAAPPVDDLGRDRDGGRRDDADDADAVDAADAAHGPVVPRVVEAYETVASEELESAEWVSEELETLEELEEIKPPSPPPPTPPAAKRRRSWYEDVFADHFAAMVPEGAARAAARDVDFMLSASNLPENASILDVGCGTGLHCLAFADRGHRAVGVDSSMSQLLHAARHNERAGDVATFQHGDMRDLEIDASFDLVTCLGTTFGYFEDEENVRCLEQLRDRLSADGKLMLHVFNRDNIVGQLPCRSWWQASGCVVLDEAELNYVANRLRVHRTVVFEDGRQFEHYMFIRAYSLHDLGKMLSAAEMRVLDVSGSRETRGRFYGAASPDLWILAGRQS